MEPKQLFEKALEEATGVVRCIGNGSFTNATPCTDWNTQQLLAHMLYELSWVPDLLVGKTIAQVGDKYDGDLLGQDHHNNWHLAAHKAMDAVKKVDPKTTVHLSYGDKPAEDYLYEIGNDLLIHAWDADQSIYCSLRFEPTVAQALYDKMLSRKDELANSGLFGRPFMVPASARIQTKLLALVGRHEPSV